MLHKLPGISCVAERLSTSQEELGQRDMFVSDIPGRLGYASEGPRRVRKNYGSANENGIRYFLQ
jgi:hypothetical protein